MWNKRFEFKYGDVSVYFGPGVLAERFPCTVQGSRRALIVSSRNAAKMSGALKDITSQLQANGVEFEQYSDVSPNPTTDTVDEIAMIARRFNPDVFIAIGGGSVIDSAKVASILYETGQTALEYINRGSNSELRRVKLIVVNLTHGTGSEVDRFAVLTKQGTIEKVGFPARYSDASFDDPTYTISLPADQSLYTTIDALYHAYESATSRRSNLLVSDLAEKSISIITVYLKRVMENLRDLEARTMLLYASMLSGISIDLTRGTHLAHALEHGLSGFNPKIPHGAGLALIGPVVAYYTHLAVPEISARLLRHIDPEIKPISEHAHKARKALETFQEKFGFDKKLSDFGIHEEDLEDIVEFVESTIKARYGSNIPFEISRELLIKILKEVA